MLFATSLAAFTVLASSALGAPTDSLLPRASPAIKSQITTNGKQYYYRGCYDELKGGLHALNHDVTSSLPGPLTVETCVAACAAQGFSIAGVMYGSTCACDNAISEAAPQLDDGQCNLTCNGDATEFCGGVWHYGIYYTNKRGSIPVPRIPTTVGSGKGLFLNIGCWKDNVQSRTLDGAYYRGSDVTPSMCANYCYENNFRVAGVEFGRECFCGQELLNPDYAVLSDCNEACAGDSTLSCGAADRLSVYVGLDRPDVLRPEIIAGTDLTNQYISYGCYSDSYGARALAGYSYTSNNMTASACAAKCYAKNFKYAGLELGNQCFCGNTLPADDQVDASHCDTPCAGDPAHSCGGGLRLDVYKSLLLASSLTLSFLEYIPDPLGEGLTNLYQALSIPTKKSDEVFSRPDLVIAIHTLVSTLMSESATGRIPVEIWQRILAFSVYVGPIYPLPEDGFLENILVFQNDCYISSAYYAAECTFRRLRLVCSSWNTFLSSLSNGFVAIPRGWHDPDIWPTDERIITAKRIQVVGHFQCDCPTKPCRYSRRWNAERPYKEVNFLPPGGFEALIDRYGEVQILVLQGASGWGRFRTDIARLTESLPNLRALSTHLDIPWFPVQEAFPQLTHLELTSFDPNLFPVGLKFSTLMTLSISVHARVSIQSWYPLRTWDLPKLLYLCIEGGFNKSFVDSHLSTLLQATGDGLRGLGVMQTTTPIMSPNGFSFPAEIWSWCPRLASIGGTAQSLQRMPSPPPSVSIESVVLRGIFGKGELPREAESQPRETSHIVAKCSTWGVNQFRLKWTWEIWLHRFHRRPLARRAEWLNFLVQFGLYGSRHGPSLRDANGVAFDDERAAFVRQAVQVEVVMIYERLETTSWTKFAFKR